MTEAAAPAQQEKWLNLRALLEEMIQRDASDLHITAGENPKLRVDGDMVSSNEWQKPLSPKETLQIAYSVLTEDQKKRFENDDELDFRSAFRICPGFAAIASSSVAAQPL